jgi:hypothetical protein
MFRRGLALVHPETVAAAATAGGAAGGRSSSGEASPPDDGAGLFTPVMANVTSDSFLEALGIKSTNNKQVVAAWKNWFGIAHCSTSPRRWRRSTD